MPNHYQSPVGSSARYVALDMTALLSSSLQLARLRVTTLATTEHEKSLIGILLRPAIDEESHERSDVRRDSALGAGRRVIPLWHRRPACPRCPALPRHPLRRPGNKPQRPSSLRTQRHTRPFRAARSLSLHLHGLCVLCVL